MTKVQERSVEQVSVALEYVQGKRRVERVMEAAIALIDRYAEKNDPAARMESAYELVRRNLSPQTWLRFGEAEFGAPLPAAPDEAEDFELSFHATNGVACGSFQARYTSDNPLMLTPPEWRSALRLLVGFAAIAAGGYAA